jgi:hypothetical protein
VNNAIRYDRPAWKGVACRIHGALAHRSWISFLILDDFGLWRLELLSVQFPRSNKDGDGARSLRRERLQAIRKLFWTSGCRSTFRLVSIELQRTTRPANVVSSIVNTEITAKRRGYFTSLNTAGFGELCR